METSSVDCTFQKRRKRGIGETINPAELKKENVIEIGSDYDELNQKLL